MTPETISEMLEKEILAGAYAPGTALVQDALARRFGVSRIPVRDALARLAQAGLVDLAPNRRARVIRMSPADISEAYDLRLMLECDLLKRAIPRMNPAHHQTIRYARDRSSLEARNENWAEGDALFHTALYSPAGRHRQMSMIDALRRACRIQIAAYDQLPETTGRWLADHDTLTRCSLAGDTAAAVSTLRAHLCAARDALLAQIGNRTTC